MRRKQTVVSLMLTCLALLHTSQNDQIKALDFFKRPANSQIECEAWFIRLKNIDTLACPSRHGSFLAENLEVQHGIKSLLHIVSQNCSVFLFPI